MKMKKIFRWEESIEILKHLGLIGNIQLLKNLSQEFRLKNISETRNYLLEEVNQRKIDE